MRSPYALPTLIALLVLAGCGGSEPTSTDPGAVTRKPTLGTDA